MITREPTEALLAEWKGTWEKYRGKLKPNRKTGEELYAYLEENYALEEIKGGEAAQVVRGNVLENEPFAEKLKAGETPQPKAFYVKAQGKGARLYQPENRDPAGLWGDGASRIFVGVDLASGYYMVEGSTLLWDELCAFQGLDEKDLENYVCVAQYIGALHRFGRLEEAPL